MVLKLLRKPLKCSFCGKSEDRVDKLIAGPKVRICDACVGICTKILEATPAGFSGWESLSEEKLLDGLAASEAAVVGMREVLQQQVDMLRKRGVSWAAIAAALGISRQAAWERFS
jgi:hypothetical protein